MAARAPGGGGGGRGGVVVGGGGGAAAGARKPPGRGVGAPFHIRPRQHASFYPTELELEFLAGDTVIDIVPNFRSDAETEFIAADIGPFSPGVNAKVPLWVGVQLKQLKRCTIKAPAWLDKTLLLKALELEKKSDVFQDLNPHYIEIATLLLSVASDNIEDAAAIRTIIEYVLLPSHCDMLPPLPLTFVPCHNPYTLDLLWETVNVVWLLELVCLDRGFGVFPRNNVSHH